MDGSAMRERRRSLGMTQANFAKAIGLSRDYIGQMERDAALIDPRTAAAVLALRPPSAEEARMTDPMERLIEEALIDAGVPFQREGTAGANQRLDFYLPAFDTYIEVKRFHTDRVSRQMESVPNIIVAQGATAVQTLATAIRGGLFASAR